MIQSKNKQLKSLFFAFAFLFVQFFGLVGGNVYAIQAGGMENFAQNRIDGSGECAGDEDVLDNEAQGLENNPIICALADVINVLAYGVGAVVILAIIVSGIQYMISQGNPQKTAAARDRIVSSLIALALYALMFAIVQWLVPGGVFNA